MRVVLASMLLTAVLPILPAGCGRAPGTARAPGPQDLDGLSVVVERLGALHETRYDVTVSSDGHRLAYSTGKDSKWRVVVNGEAGDVYKSVGQIAISPDGKHLAYVARKADGVCVVADGKEGATHYSARSPVYSPDSKHLAYMARDDAANEYGFFQSWYVVHDGKAGPECHWHRPGDRCPFCSGAFELTFSPDGSRLAYIGQYFRWRERKYGEFMVVDGRKGPLYPGVGWPKFSRDGRRIAYPAIDYDAEYYVVDGQAGPKFDHVRGFAFSPLGRHFAYEAHDANNVASVILDGEVLKGALTVPVFSPDDSRMAYVAGTEKEQWVVVDGQMGPKYESIEHLTFSPDGRRVAYVASSFMDHHGIKWCVIVDGEAGPKYDKVEPPIFSPDGKRVAYVAWIFHPMYLAVVDGKEGPVFDGSVSNLTFSPDGKRVAYEAQRGESQFVLVVDGEEVPYDGFLQRGPLFSPHGRRLAYVIRKKDKGVVIADGRAQTAYDAIGGVGYVYHVSPTNPSVGRREFCMSYVTEGGRWEVSEPGISFSPDGSLLAYPAKKGKNWHMVVNGREGPPFDKIIRNGPAFLSDGSLAYLAIRDKTLYRVRHMQGPPGN